MTEKYKLINIYALGFGVPTCIEILTGKARSQNITHSIGNICGRLFPMAVHTYIHDTIVLLPCILVLVVAK